MRIARSLPGLLAFCSLLPGCTQPFGVRNGGGNDVRTVASVGDRNLPIRSGFPDSSVRAQDPEPIIASSNRGSISGRVYDAQGKPVPNARVRLGISGAAGGKAVTANTDRSGAFTLRGLRPGSTYTVIAEAQGQGSLLTGRVETEAPDADVRISLERKRTGGDEPRTSVRPARPSVAPISQVEDDDEPADDNSAGPAFNKEDIDPPAPEAETVHRGNAGRTDQGGALDESSGAGQGWTKGRRDAEPSRARTNRSPAAEGTARSRRGSAALDPNDDDDVNPLPPALEPLNVGSSEAGERRLRDPVMLAAVQGGGAAAGSRKTSSATRAAAAAPSPRSEALVEEDPPRPLPSGLVAGARRVVPDSYGPLLLTDPEAARSPRMSRQVQPAASRARRSPPAASSPVRSRPTWGELSFQKQPIPVDEGLQKVSHALAASRPAPAQSLRGGAAARQAASGPAASPRALPGKPGVYCDFDPMEKRLLDFQLPDAQGRMVSFRELDADLILLDFWGTWCDPCRKSIPHLSELQKTLGGKKLQVIGIACERTPPKDRAARVARSVKELGINYPVLVSAMDGSCPVQDALLIQFYPTMVLVNRQGQILWREQGATDVTLARMDRFIARHLGIPGPSGDSSPPELARSRP